LVLLPSKQDDLFLLRLSEADDLIDAVCEVYERLPEDLQAELPLRRIWAVVPTA